MRKLIIASIIVVMVVISAIYHINKQENHEQATEQFIKKWLINENGTLATYIKESKEVDGDFVQGREALSETLGLWMDYALEIENEQLFNNAFNTLTEYFLEEDGFIHWKLGKSGESEVYTNALVDDLRLVDALFDGYGKWKNEHYIDVAMEISNYLAQFSTTQDVLTDFYDRKHQDSSNFVTVSYIDPEPLEKMLNYRSLGQRTYQNTIAVLVNAPLENGFYPKTYHVNKGFYQFDDEINMIDQALVAYHLAKLNMVSTEFIQFIKDEISTSGVVAGMYDKNSKKPVVTYESPAVYGLLILLCLETDNYSLAHKLYERMTEFRNDRKRDEFYGGYSVSPSGNTHIFDNIVPLLAERKLIKSLNKK
ncbi:glycosyl hydrolase [Gracilibacillus sp. D59]|uniref:glycosyl hydrolase n=1 Tax=Gracilibacillus sp. D59 TaxID=3457434 RepID=UPI003FCCED50